MSNKTYTRFVNVWFLLIMVLSVFPMTFATPISAEAAGQKKQMITLIKKERKRVGCDKTKKKTKLNHAAKRHTKDMHRNDFFSATGSDGSTLTNRVEDEGYKWSQLGHILASAPGSNAEQVFNLWMDSDAQREYIQDCSFKHIGVSKTGDKWTVIFGLKS